MVAKEFVLELSRIRWNFDWTCDGEGQRIRAKVKSRRGGVLLDPLSALCYSKTGLLYDESNWFQAAEEIELSHIDAADVMAAANNISNHRPLRYIDGLRLQMMQALLLHPRNAVERAEDFRNTASVVRSLPS